MGNCRPVVTTGVLVAVGVSVDSGDAAGVSLGLEDGVGEGEEAVDALSDGAAEAAGALSDGVAETADVLSDGAAETAGLSAVGAVGVSVDAASALTDEAGVALAAGAPLSVAF